MEVVQHDLRLETDRVFVAFDKTPELPSGLLDVELRVLPHGLGELVVARHGRVVLHDIQDESFLDRLLHRVAMKRAVLDGAVGLRVRFAEDLERLVLWCRGEGEIAGGREQLARLHQAVDLILVCLLIALFTGLGKCLGHGRAGLPALARMRLVDDDGEASPAVLVADLIQDEREFLHRGDDDFLARLDKAAQIARSIGMGHGGLHLGVLSDRIANLLVENATVRHHYDRIEDRRCVRLEPNQLVSEPGDGVALAAARRVLDQVPFTVAVRAGVGKKFAHGIELVVTRPDLHPFCLTGLLIPGRNNLGVVFQDVGEASSSQHLPPQVVGLETVRVWRVAGAVVRAAVERQKPRGLASQVRAELDLVLVHGEVGHTAAELEQFLTRIAVLLVLPDGVVHRLFREVVLQFEGEDRQSVDEKPDIQRPLRSCPGCSEAAG